MLKSRVLYLVGGSLNPSGKHHKEMVQIIQPICTGDDLIVVVPCGMRPDKDTTNDISPIHRAAMCTMTFAGMDRVIIDLSDLENTEFTRTWDLEERYQRLYPNAKIVHVIGADLIKGGRAGNSEIHTWYKGPDLLNKSNFLVFPRGEELDKNDLPYNHRIIETQIHGSSTEIRKLRMERESIEDLVTPAVAEYINRWHLYTGRPSSFEATQFCPKGRADVIIDRKQPQALEILKIVERVYSSRTGPIDHLIVIGGDGFMLDAINKFHHRCLPFLGLNAGTVGHLLNNGGNETIERCLQASSFHLHQSPLLYAQATGEDGKTHSVYAFNDLFLRTDTQSAGWMQVSVNKKVRFERMMGDGLMLSTPAGSTGWAYKKGATPVMIGTPQIVLTGDGVSDDRGIRWVSAPLSNTAIVEVDVLESWRPMILVVDGHEDESIGRVKNVIMRQCHAHAVELTFFPETNLAEKITRLQFGGI
ncbi:NAD(+)/NADH kinase [Candidatus Uhrbacteria bacterium]|nr:NAD(+)/NADH kinase [Candidatus Uhrbacteria bacterium]